MVVSSPAGYHSTTLLIYYNIRFALVFNYEIMNDNTRKILLSGAVVSKTTTKIFSKKTTAAQNKTSILKSLYKDNYKDIYR